MSWFSDLAKTALNEAQKRIDKVLDIDEEAAVKSDGSLLNKTSYIEDSAVSDTLTKSRAQLQSSILTTNKLNKGNSSSKKRGKPLKLGSSLSKKQTFQKPNSRRSADEDKELKQPSSTTVPSNIFEEVSLNDSSSLSNNSDCGAPNNSFRNFSLEQSENELPNFDDVDVVQRSSIKDKLSPKLDLKQNGDHVAADSKFSKGDARSEEVPSPEEKPLYEGGGTFTETSPACNQCENQVADDHASFESQQSSYTSTTVSSETEVLDKECAINQPITEDLCDANQHLPVVGEDEISHSETSPDPRETDALDVVQISGQCSSPISASGRDGMDVLRPCPDPSVQFIGSEDISPIKVPLENLTENLATTPEVGPEEPLSTDNSAILTPDNTKSSCAPNLEESIPTDEAPNDFNENPAPPHLQLEAESASVNEVDIVEVSSAMYEAIDDESEAEENNAVSTLLSTSEAEVSASSVNEATVADEKENDQSQSRDATSQVELSAMMKKLEACEQQLVTLSLSNANLSEANDNLRSEMSNLRQAEEMQLDDERQNLIGTVESLSNKLEILELEKSEMQSELVAVQAELSTRLSNEQVQSLLAEKEESIQGLLLEGETLSKTHLQQSNTIKKLRTKLSEQNTSNKELKEKLVVFEEENKSLKFRLAEIQGQSCEDRGAAERLSEAFQEREMQLSEMRSKLEEAEEKRRAAQSTLDAAYKDLAEMNKKQATMQSDREAELQEHEVSVKKKMQQEIDKLQQDHDHQIHMRLLQLGELQDSVERNEATFTRKEDQLRREVKDLQQRLHDSELRNHDLSESISESTRPILRQMENLQSTYAAQTKTWEALEKSLTSRLGDAQIQLVASQDKERSLQTSVVDLKSRIVTTEQQLNDVRQAKASLDAELTTLRTKSAQYDDKITKLRKELEGCETTCEEVKSKARRDRLTLENQLDMEKVRSEADKKKFLAQLENVQKEKERLLWMSRSDSMTSSASMLNVDAESVASSSDTFNTFEVFERQSSSLGLPNGVYDSVRSGTSGPSLLENLQSQLKMRDGEIAQLQGEINTLERTRSSMAEEIVRLTNDNEDLHSTAKHVEALRISLKDVESRHEAVLTMYGEKAEEAEELKMDLEDVKMMYRNQIDTLLKSH